MNYKYTLYHVSMPDLMVNYILQCLKLARKVNGPMNIQAEGRKHLKDISGRERGCKLNFRSTSIYSLKEPLIFNYMPFYLASPHPDTFLFLGA